MNHPAMKFLILFIFSLFIFNAHTQDFNVEYKAFMLQSFFKEHQIKTLTIQKSDDSLFIDKSIQYKLEFDQQGRLVKIYDYYFATGTIPERVITYRYNNESRYYMAKEYHYLDNMQNVVLTKKWKLHFDLINNVLEENFFKGKQKYRTNKLVFNKAMQILSRTVQAFMVKFRTCFTYGKDGLLKHVKIIKENPTVKEMKSLELNHYLQYNKYQKIMTTEQWVGERDKQINEYFFNYKGQNIVTKTGWSLINWNDSDQKIVERTNFSYCKNGLLAKADLFIGQTVSAKHKYIGFEYSYFSDGITIKGSSHKFTMLWFTDIFSKNLVHT